MLSFLQLWIGARSTTVDASSCAWPHHRSASSHPSTHVLVLTTWCWAKIWGNVFLVRSPFWRKVLKGHLRYKMIKIWSKQSFSVIINYVKCHFQCSTFHDLMNGIFLLDSCSNNSTINPAQSSYHRPPSYNPTHYTKNVCPKNQQDFSSNHHHCGEDTNHRSFQSQNLPRQHSLWSDHTDK